MVYLIFFMKTSLVLCALMTAQTCLATIKKGDNLPALAIKTNPQSFYYEPNGYAQMLTIYPASLTSSRNGAFNADVIKAGYCPKSIIDIKNRAWYVPQKTAESAVNESILAPTHNALCTVSIDHTGKAIKHWQLNKKSTTIIVNGAGKVIFVEEGVLDQKERAKVIQLLTKYGKPYSHWPKATRMQPLKDSTE